MPLRNTAEAYGSLARFLHWSIVLLIVPQYFIAEAAEELPKGLERLQLMDWHKSLGMLVLLLTLCLLYTSPSPRDRTRSRMPASA